MLGVAEGLSHLHSKNILHHDIKLENIVMSDNSESAQPYILDFGSAAQLNSPTEMQRVLIGTSGYKAPEIVQKLVHGLPSDIWSLGATIFHMVADQLPFWREDEQARDHATCFEDAGVELAFGNMSDSLKDLVQQMLRKEPLDRPTIGEVL